MTRLSQDDVLQSVYRFLLQSGFTSTIAALQLESRCPFNHILVRSLDPIDAASVLRCSSSSLSSSSSSSGTVVWLNEETLSLIVKNGLWDILISKVLRHVTLLPQALMVEMYELIFEELLFVFQIPSAARAILHNTATLQALRTRNPVHYERLAAQLERSQVAASSAPIEPTTGDDVPVAFQQRRDALLRALLSHVVFVTEEQLERTSDLCRLIVGSRRRHTTSSKRSRSNDHQGEEDVPSVSDGESSTSVGRIPTYSVVTGVLQNCVSQALSFPTSVDVGDTGDATVATTSAVTSMISFRLANTSTLTVVAALSDGRVVELPDYNNNLDLTQKTQLQPTVLFQLPQDTVTAMAADVNAASTWIAVGGRGGTLRVYSYHARKLVRKIAHEDNGYAIHAVRFLGSRVGGPFEHHRGHLVFAGTRGSLTVASIATGAAVVRVASAHNGSYVLGLAVTPSRGEQDEEAADALPVMATCGQDGTLQVWKTEASAEQHAPSVTPLLRHGSLSAIHSYLTDELPTTVQECPRHSNLEHAVVLACRSGKLCVVSLSPLMVLYFIQAASMVRSVSLAMWGNDVSQVRLFAAVEDGTVVQYRLSVTAAEASRGRTDGAGSTPPSLADAVRPVLTVDSTSSAFLAAAGTALEDTVIHAIRTNEEGNRCRVFGYGSTVSKLYAVDTQ